MQIFKDVNGLEWKIDLNLYTAKALSQYLESLDPPVNLFDAASFMPRVSSILFAVDCLAVLTYDERKERGIDDIQFGKALKGEYAYSAARALMCDYCDFFPDPQLQQTLKQSLKRLEEISLKEQTIVEGVLIQAIKEREKLVDSLAKEIGGATSQN